MTVSGVRSSWLTSARRVRRASSFAARRELIALNARASERTSDGPRSGTCVPISPASTRPAASMRSPTGALARRKTRATAPRTRRRSATATISASAPLAEQLADGPRDERDQAADEEDEEQEGATEAPHEAPARVTPRRAIGGWPCLALRPPARAPAVRRSPAPAAPSVRSGLRHRPGGIPRRTRSAGDAADADPPRSCGGCCARARRSPARTTRTPRRGSRRAAGTG